jgi:transposase InsO family protein
MTGLPTLRAEFPGLARRELIHLARRYRWVLRWKHRRPAWRLKWGRPGVAWAMDHAQPPSPIDGVFPYLLSVRDLASGFQLAWQPMPDTTAASTVRLLGRLFSEHGQPLILKCDNGSAFSAASLREFLAAHDVTPLYSPPHWPRYNGACEAGIGRLKDRTAWQAVCTSLDGTWTGQNVRKALAITNDLIR